MGDMLIGMLQQILGSAFASGADGLRQSVASYNADIYNFAVTVNDVAVKPVAATILGIVVMMELANIMQKYDGARQAGLQVLIMQLLKVMIIMTVIQQAHLVLAAMNEGAEMIIGNVSTLGDRVIADGLPDAAKNAVNDMGTFEQAGLMMILFIPWLLSLVVEIALKLIVLVRFAELYILSSAVSLPMSFMAHPETKSIAIGYLRGYGGVLIQGIVVVIVVGIYSYFQVDSVDLSGVDGDNILSTITTNVSQLILAPAFFLVLIFGASKFAKRFVGKG